MDDLLLLRVEERHIHFLAKRGVPLDGLHEANVLQKSDLVHGAQLGLVAGALVGCIGGGLLVWLVFTEPAHQLATVLGTTAFGAFFGTWVASMVGSAVPNSRLRIFQDALERGNVLLMVDVPEHKVDVIKSRLGSSHPEAMDGGVEPNIPAFP